jgi:hypothetical protein
VAQMVEALPSMLEALGSILSNIHIYRDSSLCIRQQ